MPISPPTSEWVWALPEDPPGCRLPLPCSALRSLCMTDVRLCVTPRTVAGQAPLQEILQARALEAAVSLSQCPLWLPGAPPHELYHLRFQEPDLHRPVAGQKALWFAGLRSGDHLEHHFLGEAPPAYTSTNRAARPSLMSRGSLKRGLLFSNLLSLHAADTPLGNEAFSCGPWESTAGGFSHSCGVLLMRQGQGGPQGAKQWVPVSAAPSVFTDEAGK